MRKTQMESGCAGEQGSGDAPSLRVRSQYLPHRVLVSYLLELIAIRYMTVDLICQTYTIDATT